MLAPECLYFPTREFTEKKEKLVTGEKLELFSKKGQSTVVRQLRGIVQSSQSALKTNQLKLDFSHDKEFYRCKNVSSLAAFLFSRDFLKTFLLQGSLFLQTDVKDHIIDEFLVIVPDGRLLICMDQFTSSQFGLSECKKYDCGDGRVIFEMNLKNALTSPDQGGTKQMSQWRTCLSNIEHIFSEPIIVAWQPHDRCICPSTIAKFFQDNDANIEIVETNVDYFERTLEQYPDFVSKDNIADCLSWDINDFDFEAIENWLGGHLLKLTPDELSNLSNTASLDYTSHFGASQEATMLEIRGLFMPSDIEQMISSIQDSLQIDGWAIITTFPSVDSLFLRHSNMKAKTLLSASQTLIIYKNVIFVRSKRK